MSGYALTKNIVNATRRILWQSLSRPVHGVAENQDNLNDQVEADFPIKLEKNPFEKEQMKCILCKHHIEPDYKNVRLLSQFQSRYTGKIYGRHITGLCTDKQRKVEREIMKAQNAGLMGYYFKDVSYVHDPPLFDPDHPFRPHKY